MINLHKFSEDCFLVRRQSPLVHNITNYVAMNISANALLAIGASPIMSFYESEMEEIAGISSALIINIGCLDNQQITAMYKAASTAHRLNKPWVLDPVGAGASKVRTNTALELIYKFKPSIIRANASEIMSLSGKTIESRGVDSNDSSNDAVKSAQLFAKETGAVVSISGAIDYITDGYKTEIISNGSPLMPKITAMGCTASAITAAFAAVDSDYFCAALNAMALMGVCGEIAASKCQGTASLALNFIDKLSNFDPEELSQKIRQ